MRIEESAMFQLILARGAPTPNPWKWLRLPETNPLFDENDLITPSRRVRFPKRNHRKLSSIFSVTLIRIAGCVQNRAAKRWVRFAETYTGPLAWLSKRPREAGSRHFVAP